MSGWAGRLRRRLPGWLTAGAGKDPWDRPG